MKFAPFSSSGTFLLRPLFFGKTSSITLCTFPVFIVAILGGNTSSGILFELKNHICMHITLWGPLMRTLTKICFY